MVRAWRKKDSLLHLLKEEENTTGNRIRIVVFKDSTAAKKLKFQPKARKDKKDSSKTNSQS